MAGGADFMGESQELRFGHVRLEMPCIGIQVEMLGGGWVYVSLESREEAISTCMACKTGN